jgi:hypothetical protein
MAARFFSFHLYQNMQTVNQGYEHICRVGRFALPFPAGATSQTFDF